MYPPNTPYLRLRHLLEALPVTQSEIARALCVDNSLVSKWVRGRRRLLLDTPYVEQIAQTLAAREMAPIIRRWLAYTVGLSGEVTDVQLKGAIQRYICALPTEAQKNGEDPRNEEVAQ